jgi:hypothetical protein
MSQIQRYTARGYEVGVDDPEPYPDDLVRYSDYAALEAQVEALQRENERLKAPVSDEEWSNVYGYSADDEYASREFIDSLIASRATQPAPQEPK